MEPTMHIEHVAIWTTDLERLKHFYARFFGASAGEKYVNARRCFESYFLTFASGARLELMSIAGLDAARTLQTAPATGYVHLAIALGSTTRVDALTAEVRLAGFAVASEPRWTGDGYYESVILDPDGNQLELTV